jgi:hypothetical protein
VIGVKGIQIRSGTELAGALSRADRALQNVSRMGGYFELDMVELMELSRFCDDAADAVDDLIREVKKYGEEK